MLRGTGGKFHKVAAEEKGIHIEKVWVLQIPIPHQISIPFSPAGSLAGLKSIYLQLKQNVMAEIKRKTLLLSSGKQIKLTGTGLAIAKNLNVSEGYVPYVFSCAEEQKENATGSIILNPHKLTADEIYDLADYNIKLWMDLKANIRKYGSNDPRIFSADYASYQNANTSVDPENPKKKRIKQAE